MPNQYVNKVQLGNEVLLDLTADTVAPGTLLLGYTAHDASGAPITGTASGGHAAITGTEPEAFIRGMTSQRMTMLHVQDTDYRSDTHTLPYLGSQNWEEITSALAEIGFMGFMNLEVLHYYNRFPKAMIPDALKLAAASARTLAAMVEEKKAALHSR